MKRYWIKCEYAEKELSEGLTIGWERGCSIKLPDGEKTARVHARVKVSDERRWTLTAVNPENPIIDAGGQKVQSVMLGDKVAFRIGTTFFSCVEMAESKGSAKEIKPITPAIADLPPPRRPPKGVKTLQYFFRDKLYRIAVLGGREAGKTCMFAALSMPRMSRNDDATCTRILHLQEPATQPWQKTPEDKEAENAFQMGKCLLDEGEVIDGVYRSGAIDSLLQGKVPRATSNDTVDARIVFKFVSPLRKSAILETVDYAGEFASPDMAAKEQAQRIRDIMQKSHGLIVLAQVPMPGGDYDKEVAAIDQMAKAFSMLQLGGSIPIALVVNKWDRMDAFGAAPTTHDEECKRLSEYVASDKGQHLKGLVDALHHTVGKDNFCMFPVSALGQCEISGDKKNQIERPRQNLPLQSFGLEDPFFWLMDRVDAISVREYESDVKTMSFIPWNTLWSKPARMLRERKTRMLSGDISDKQLLSSVKRIGRRHAFKRFVAWIQLTVLAVAAVLTGEYLVSSRQFVEPYRALKNEPPVTSQSAYKERQKHTLQLQPYVDSTPFRHSLLALVLSHKNVIEQINESDKMQRNFLLATIRDATKTWDFRVSALDTFRNDFRHDVPRHSELLDATDRQYADKLWSELTRNEERLKQRLEVANAFIHRYPDDRRKQDADHIIVGVKAAEAVAKEAEDALLKTMPDWAAFATALTNARFRQIDYDLRQRIVFDVTEIFDGRLLYFVNESIHKLRDFTRTENNAELLLLQRSYESLFAMPQTRNLGARISVGIDLFQKAISDRRIYHSANHTSRENCVSYLSKAGSGEIPGFMQKETKQFLENPFSGEIVIERIEWTKGLLDDKRPMTLRIKDAAVKTALELTEFAAFEGGKSTEVGQTFKRDGLRMNIPTYFEIEMEMHARFRINPIFRAKLSRHPDELFKGVKVRVSETQDTGYGRSAYTYIRLIHHHRPQEWTARRFLNIESLEWQ